MTCVSPVMRRQSFDVSGLLSAGTYAQVFSHGERTALKASSNLRMSAGLDGDNDSDVDLGDTQKDLLRRAELIEAMILRRFSQHRHANLAYADQIFFDSFVQNMQFSLVLSLDLATGSLVEFMKARGDQFDSKTCTKFLREIASAVEVLHQAGICHADLKPGNILVKVASDDSLYVVVADFGLSTLPMFAVHGHAAESYTFGHVPPECCDNFQAAPFLIRNTADANSALCSFSCFSDPVRLRAEPLAPPSSPSSSLTDELRPNSCFCNDVTPRQATRFTFENVTRANFASDVWAFASVALFLFARGKHPIVDYCFERVEGIRFPREQVITYNLYHRLQMTVWFRVLSKHQKTLNWQKVFDFEAVAEEFERYLSQKTFTAEVKSFETLPLVSPSGLDLLYGCLQFLPSERISVADICRHAYFSDELDTIQKSGRKRSNGGSQETPIKKLRDTKQSPLDLLISRSLVFSTSVQAVKMPFHRETIQMILKIATTFGLSVKSILLANAYMQISASRLDKRKKIDTWSRKFCLDHAATCLLIAVSLFEARHEACFDVVELVSHFGDEYELGKSEIALLQRLVAEVLDFEFDVPTCAHVIDAALSETNTTHLMPKSVMTSRVLLLLQTSPVQFSCSQTVPVALAILKRFGCDEAFEKLLSASGRNRLSVDQTLKFIE